MVISRIVSRGIIPIVSVEGSYTYTKSTYIIKGEFSNRGKIILVIYIFINKGSKLYLNLLVKDLYLFVGRGIKGSAHPRFNADELKELFLGLTSKA